MEHRAAEIHAGLKHPVIDGDGHWMEPIPNKGAKLTPLGNPIVSFLSGLPAVICLLVAILKIIARASSDALDR